MKLFILFLITCVRRMAFGKIEIERLEHQVDPKFGEVKHEIKQVDGHTTLDVDVQCFKDFADVKVHIAAYSKIDGKFNEFLKPKPVTACTIKNSESVLIKFVYNEIGKYGNLTESCPIKKGHYYLHGFKLFREDFPIPIPKGEFRIDLNATVLEEGHEEHENKIYSLELYFSSK